MMIDDQVGRVLDGLKKSGKYENTVIIFTSDHGDMAGEHGMFWKSTGSFYDGVARVPLVISAPGCNKDARFADPVEHVDLMPTILEMCGFNPPSGIHGASLVPVLSGGKPTKDTAFSERLGINREHTRRPHTDDPHYGFMFRSGQFKYVTYKNENSAEHYLYDLKSDPKEYVNLANEKSHAGDLAKMHRLLKQRLEETGYTGALAFEGKGQ
jgi:arylsulfatase A-like enzyme